MLRAPPPCPALTPFLLPPSAPCPSHTARTLPFLATAAAAAAASSWRPQWNELRAALNYHSLVGLAYIHDPGHDPREHVDDALDLLRRVADAAPYVDDGDGDDGNDGDGPTDDGGCAAGRAGAPAGCGVSGSSGCAALDMYVFVLHEADGVNGDLLIEEEGEEGEGEEEDGEQGGRGRGRACRAVTFGEYLSGLGLPPVPPQGR